MSLQLREFIAAVEPLRLTDLIVAKHGQRVGEYHREEEIRRNQYSASKSFTSTAVGIAVREGLFALDDLVCEHFEQELPASPPHELLRLTVRDLLTMCLGQDAAYLMAADRFKIGVDDWVRYSLSRPFVQEPGTQFRYTNVGPYLAGILLQRRAGCNLVDYLMPRLFQPVGIQRPTWEVDPQGFTFGAGGLFLATSEILRFGQLYLQEGCWNGKQLVPREWVREASKLQVQTGSGDGLNGFGYGYLFWRGPHDSYRADGKYGQYVYVLNKEQAVIAVNSESDDAGKIQDAVWEYIYPQIC